MQHRLWDLAFLQGMWQDASACCAHLKQQHVYAHGFHFPIVAAVSTVAAEIANEWSRQVLGKKRAIMKHFKMRRDRRVAVAADWSGPLPPKQQQPGNQTKAKHLLGFMMNFGLSGGMNPAGDTLAVHRWWDFGLYVQSLKADWGFAVGCRRPPGLDIQQALPGFPYEVTGHASLAYDAVSIFCVASLATSVQWMPDKSKSTRSCWVNIAGAEIHSALYVPPPSSVAKEERHSIVLSYFQEWDAVVSEVNRTDQKMASRTLISGCGDLNMTPDLKLLFEQCLQARGLWWALQPTAATHVKGGILDFFWCERDSAKAPPILHDGQVCLSRGCRNPLCGNLADATASKDLDHYAWTFTTTLTRFPAADTAFGLYFSKDADMWECAVHSLGEKVMELLALDLSTALPSSQAWPWLTSKQRKCALNACAGLWDVLMTMVGYGAGLVTLKPLSRSPKVPKAVKQAFHAMVRLSKLKPHGATPAEALRMKQAAQHEYRQQVALHRKAALKFRCSRYLQLCTSKDPQADAFLSKCLKKNASGLPDNMVNDEGEVLHSQDVLHGAASYLVQLQCPPPFADMDHRVQCDNVLLQVRSEMRSRVNDSLPLTVPKITPELLSNAYQGIDPSAECCGLPYVALLVPNPAHVSWVHSLHSLMHAFAVSPFVWTKQSLYHSLKPGRSPNAFMSYRVLGLNTAQGRLQEELFIQFEPDLWRHTGNFQEGRQECLVVVAADLCIASMRLELGLPFGLCLNDRKEAFDTQWRSSMLINLASGVSCPRSWCLADELLRTTSMSVVKCGTRSRSFSSHVGVVQGRKLSPLEFCIGQQNLEEHAAQNMVGIGIDPPALAVEAYHRHRDGHSTDAPYDVDEPRHLHNLVLDGILTWSEAFSRASSDTCRLILLDLAAPTKRSIRSFMDDTRIPMASHGHATRAINLLQHVAALEQYMYKPSKCSIVASGFSQRAPVMLQGQEVNYCNEAVQLGISLDTRFDGGAHLQLLMSRGPGRMKCLLAELINLGMPMQALLTSHADADDPCSHLWH